ncbi:unnamed protein product [Peronospora destructor]|uniref:Uncharacterized protein n=1 Tax=Peronospora destructor TaxID=86335 RepID=A0AAV0VEH6_9STRA|nr:unnamed protein product [Peronospora destructor]
MQNDGQAAVEMMVDVREWTTSVEDDQQQSQEGAGVSKRADGSLPPITPVKAMPGVAAAQERVLVPVLNDGHRKQTGRKPKQGPGAIMKLAKVKTTKKVAAPEDTRRKWKTKASRSESSGISQTSATMLFRCSCQLLRNQTLDYDVRAREMEERNAAQTREIEQWEKRIRSLKRELEEYTDEQLDEATDVALVEATHRSTTRAMHEQMNETKIQDELRKRRQKVKEFCKSIPGFIQSQDEQIAHYF